MYIYIYLYLDAYDKSSEDLSPESSTVTLTNARTAVFMDKRKFKKFSNFPDPKYPFLTKTQAFIKAICQELKMSLSIKKGLRKLKWHCKAYDTESIHYENIMHGGSLLIDVIAKLFNIMLSISHTH
jgi:hypothetical protein